MLITCLCLNSQTLPFYFYFYFYFLFSAHHQTAVQESTSHQSWPPRRPACPSPITRLSLLISPAVVSDTPGPRRRAHLPIYFIYSSLLLASHQTLSPWHTDSYLFIFSCQRFRSLGVRPVISIVQPTSTCLVFQDPPIATCRGNSLQHILLVHPSGIFNN